MFNFNQKNVLVVGGTSGINRGIAEAFAKAGANVAVISRSQEKVDKTLVALKQMSTKKMAGRAVDVRDAENLKQKIIELTEEIGRWHIVVSGAAGNFPALATGMSANAFKTVVDIDLLGTFNVMQSVHPYLQKPGASIINISAPQASVAMLAQSHVCAAKAGVDMITKTLCVEWGVEGIRINSVVPGPIDTTEGMKRLAPDDNTRDMVKKSVPLKRMGTTDDVANLCLFLSSEYATYITGAIIPVDGGWLASGASTMSAVLAAAIKPA